MSSSRGSGSLVQTLRKPRTGIFHSANAPFDRVREVPVVKIRWTGWGKPVAHGDGTFRGQHGRHGTGHDRLSRARACGKSARLYTRTRNTFNGSTTRAKPPVVAADPVSIPPADPRSPGTGSMMPSVVARGMQDRRDAHPASPVLVRRTAA